MTESNDIRISVNGERKQVAAGSTLSDLLEAMGIGRDAKGVAVALGDQVVRRADWHATALTDGLQIEVVTAVQGG